jgi:hypothetical protein
MSDLTLNFTKKEYVLEIGGKSLVLNFPVCFPSQSGGGFVGALPEYLSREDAIAHGVTIGDATNGVFKIAPGSDVAPQGAMFQV